MFLLVLLNFIKVIQKKKKKKKFQITCEGDVLWFSLSSLTTAIFTIIHIS